jgi:hypothetical protein
MTLVTDGINRIQYEMSIVGSTDAHLVKQGTISCVTALPITLINNTNVVDIM